MTHITPPSVALRASDGGVALLQSYVLLHSMSRKAKNFQALCPLPHIPRG